MRYPREEQYSTRCRISHRPPFRSEKPVFYRCKECGALMVLHKNKNSTELPGVMCCGNSMELIEHCQDEQILAEHKLSFTVFGGFEKNAVQIKVDDGHHPMGTDHRIEWVYLYTYQGGQLKYLPEKGRAIAQFALADEDAYVYCDRDVCKMGREHCQFQCKRGLTAYAYCSVHGLMKLEL